MPGPDGQEVRRDGRLTTGLFWGGVGLAPIAAILLLFGPEGTPLRFAAVLTIVTIVLIGLSITLRGNAETIKADLEEVIYEEVDALRADVRQDIGTAARATHRAFGEKLQHLHQQMQGMRAELGAADGGRPGYERAVAGPAHPAAIGQGAPVAAIGAGRSAASGGVVRHTETVQVTTRQTIVDPPRDEGPRGGTVYGGGGPAEREEPEDGGWTGQHPREGRRAGGPEGEAPGRAGGHRPSAATGARQYEDDEPAYGDQWSQVRAGDRWGSVREDARGREMRMGERRAALHADGSGTEVHFEDRWASVRRDDPRDNARDEPRRVGGYGEPVRDGGYGEPARDGGYGEPRRDGAPAGHGREVGYDDYQRDGYGQEEYHRDEYPRAEPAPAGRWAEDRSGWRHESAVRGSSTGRPDEVSAGWGGDHGAHPAGHAGWDDGGDVRRGDQAPGWDDRQEGRRAGQHSGRDEGRETRGGGQAGWRQDGAGGWSQDGSAGWREQASAAWGDGRAAGRDDPRRADAGWDREQRAQPALPVGGPQQGIWEGDWVEAERQPVGGRRRRDEEPDFRYQPEPDDRWR